MSGEDMSSRTRGTITEGITDKGKPGYNWCCTGNNWCCTGDNWCCTGTNSNAPEQLVLHLNK